MDKTEDYAIFEEGGDDDDEVDADDIHPDIPMKGCCVKELAANSINYLDSG